MNEEIIIHGAVVCMCGDTPASNFVGGFKEGVEFSFHKCRQCLGTKDDINKHVSAFICIIGYYLYFYFPMFLVYT